MQIKNNILQKIYSVLFHNFLLKITALLIAVALWAGLISQDPNLTRVKEFNEVTVSINGMETMKRNGYIITSDVKENPILIHLTVDVPQLEYDDAKASNYLPRIDLSSIDKTGLQEIAITTTKSATYGEVHSITPSTVELDVDEYITKYRVPIQFESIGEYPEGLYGTIPSVDPYSVSVSGPSKLVDKVIRGIAKMDVSKYDNREGYIRSTVPIILVDENGNTIEDDNIQITSESIILRNVIVSQHLYSEKTINLSDVGVISGEPAEGYYVDSISIQPSSVTIAGEKNLLDSMDQLFINNAVQIDNAAESFTKSVNLNLPAEIQYKSVSSINVTVNIKPIIEQKTIEKISIDIDGKSNDKSVLLESKYVTAIVTGEYLKLKDFDSKMVDAIIDVSNLDVGNYTMVLQSRNNFENNNDFSIQFVPDKINIEIK